MSKIVTILRSPEGENAQFLFIDNEGDGVALGIDGLETHSQRTEAKGMMETLPGLFGWYKPEDVAKWKEHFVGYTEEAL